MTETAASLETLFHNLKQADAESIRLQHETIINDHVLRDIEKRIVAEMEACGQQQVTLPDGRVIRIEKVVRLDVGQPSG
jgi:hypothetical protein